jgi:hypothetical protein
VFSKIFFRSQQGRQSKTRGTLPANSGLLIFRAVSYIFCRKARMAKPASVTIPTELNDSTLIEARRDCSAWRPDGVKWPP